jgi:predicted nuclease with TOPRIM domain
MTKKLTEQELTDLKSIQTETNQISFSLGQIEIQKSILEDQKTGLIAEFSTLQEKQNVLAKELQDKYGVGNIDTETGEFTAVE